MALMFNLTANTWYSVTSSLSADYSKTNTHKSTGQGNLELRNTQCLVSIPVSTNKNIVALANAPTISVAQFVLASLLLSIFTSMLHTIHCQPPSLYSSR